MNEVQQQNNKASDEIDIFEFCTRMWSAFVGFLVSVKNFLVNIIVVIIRKSIWIIGFALVGIMLGYFVYNSTRRYYSSFLEGNVGEINNSAIIDHINKLNITGNASVLAGYLNMTEKEAKEIRSVKAYYGIDVNKDKRPDFIDFNEVYNPRDTNQVRVPSYIYLKVSVYDEEIFPVLRKGLLQYVNTNTYIQDLYKIEREQKKQFIAKLESEMSKIDSLQRSQYTKNSRQEKGQMIILGTEPELKLFHYELLALFTQKQKLEKELEISDEVIVVVQDFTPLSREENPIWSYFLQYGGLMAIIGFVISLFWQYRKTIWMLITEKRAEK